MTRREQLLKQVKEHAEKMRKFQQEFHKNMSNKDEMTSKDLQYMNKVFEQMKLDHEKLLTEYYNYKKPDLQLTGIDINLYYKLLSLKTNERQLVY